MKVRSWLFVPALLCAAFPAWAQGIYDRVERTRAEIVFEGAQLEFEEQKARRVIVRDLCARRDLPACYEYGELQRKGLGGSQDLVGAAKAYRLVCDAGDGRGCSGLAYLTVHGRGVASDPARGRSLYRRACDLGDVTGCAGWGNMAYTGAGGSKDVVQGTRALNGACEEGYEWACERLRSLGGFEPGDRTMERLRDLRRN